jgi:hypothetical protein
VLLAALLALALPRRAGAQTYTNENIVGISSYSAFPGLPSASVYAPYTYQVRCKGHDEKRSVCACIPLAAAASSAAPLAPPGPRRAARVRRVGPAARRLTRHTSAFVLCVCRVPLRVRTHSRRQRQPQTALASAAHACPSPSPATRPRATGSCATGSRTGSRACARGAHAAPQHANSGRMRSQPTARAPRPLAALPRADAAARAPTPRCAPPRSGLVISPLSFQSQPPAIGSSSSPYSLNAQYAYAQAAGVSSTRIYTTVGASNLTNCLTTACTYGGAVKAMWQARQYNMTGAASRPAARLRGGGGGGFSSAA